MRIEVEITPPSLDEIYDGIAALLQAGELHEEWEANLAASKIAQGMQCKANIPVKRRPVGTRRQCTKSRQSTVRQAGRGVDTRHPPALGEEAELTQMSAASRPRIPSRDLTLPKYDIAARPLAV